MSLSTLTITGTTVVVGSTDVDLEMTIVRASNGRKILGVTFNMVNGRLVVGPDCSHIGLDESWALVLDVCLD